MQIKNNNVKKSVNALIPNNLTKYLFNKKKRNLKNIRKVEQ